MALFGWKKSGATDTKDAGKAAVEGASPPAELTSATGDGFEPQPEKARRWFDHARTYADSFNYEYALVSYASGIKLDPTSMSAHEAMYEVAIKYMNKGGEAAKSKDIKGIAGDDSHPVAKFAAAEFAWMKDIANAGLAVDALEAAIKSGQLEFGHWISPKVLGVISRSKKMSKRMLVQAKDLFKQVHAWDEAIAAGQLAVRLDPSDNTLDHELKDLSAQRAMDAGGYEKAIGKEGGFRSFVKDEAKQRQLVEAEAIAGSASMDERNLARAKAEYDATPSVPDIINKYAQLVKKKGTPESEQLAFDIYMKGFKDTGEYRFRMAAGDIKIEQRRRDYEALQAKADENPSDSVLKSQADAVRRKLLELESGEVEERVAKYPTDRPLKLRLGEVQYALGRYEDAMAALQAAKDEPKLRVRAGHLLAKCFAAENWHMEAISEFKEALSAIDVVDKDRELAIRYDLMLSLVEHARTQRDVGLAREALDICSGIVRKNATYRDIRAKRKEVDQLIRDLTGGSVQG